MIGERWKSPDARTSPLHRGVYVAVTGPNLETRAEYRFLRLDRGRRGGHVDRARGDRGRSRRHAGLGLSVVTDMCLPDALEPADVEQIIAAARDAEPRLRSLILGVLAHEAARGE